SARLERRGRARARHRTEFGGDERGAGLGELLQPRGDVDAVAEQVFRRRDDDVADMGADADRRLALAALVENFLDRRERRARGRKFQHEAVAGGVEETPVVRRRHALDARAQRFDLARRVALVALGHAREANDVDRNDRGQPDRAILALFSHDYSSPRRGSLPGASPCSTYAPESTLSRRALIFWMKLPVEMPVTGRSVV